MVDTEEIHGAICENCGAIIVFKHPIPISPYDAFDTDCLECGKKFEHEITRNSTPISIEEVSQLHPLIKERIKWMPKKRFLDIGGKMIIEQTQSLSIVAWEYYQEMKENGNIT